MDINTIALTGHLAGDAVLKQTDDGKAQALFWVNVEGQSKEDCSFFRVHLCGGAAEKLVPYLVKGKQVGIAGELKEADCDPIDTDLTASFMVIDAKCVQLLGAGNNERGGKA
jgi:single-stranded DNA-binding protein